MELFGTTDYQCRCPECESLMTPFRDSDGQKAYACVECGRVINNEKFFVPVTPPVSASHAVQW